MTTDPRSTSDGFGPRRTFLRGSGAVLGVAALADSPLVFLPPEATKNLHAYAPLTQEQIPVHSDAFRRFIT